MIDGFDILLAEHTSREKLMEALAFAYGIGKEEIDLQYFGALDASAPERCLFCLVHEWEGGEFSVLLTIGSCETAAQADHISVASKITQRLNIRGLISSEDDFDDDCRLLLEGSNAPQRVRVREQYNEALNQTYYFLEE